MIQGREWAGEVRCLLPTTMLVPHLLFVTCFKRASQLQAY